MKWFKHLCDSHNDPDICDAFDKYGPAGRDVFWVTLEILGKEFNGGPSVTLSKKNWKKFTGYSVKKLTEIWSFYGETARKKQRISFEIAVDMVTVTVPKFVEIIDEYSSKHIRKEKKVSGQTPDKVRKKSALEVEGEEEVEKEGEEDTSLYDPDGVALAEEMIAAITERKPDFKAPNLKIWSRDMGRMVRRDKRQPERIRQVMLWAQDDDFWQSNILSPAKLRKQFDTLELKMDNGGGLSPAGQATARAAKEWINES